MEAGALHSRREEGVGLECVMSALRAGGECAEGDQESEGWLLGPACNRKRA